MNRRRFLELLAIAGVTSIGPGFALPHVFATGLSRSGLVYDDLFLKHILYEDHPESPDRLVYLMQAFNEAGLKDKLEQIPVYTDAGKQISLVHTSEHINKIRESYPTSFPVAVGVVGGVLAATDAVCRGEMRNAFCATRPPGHHALNTGREEGFCFFNSVAIAARYAKKQYKLRKILIVDWDYHHGNGTEAVFYDDPEVLFFSTHDLYAYPGTGSPEKTGEGAGKGFNINVHLGCGSGDAEIITAFREKLLPRMHEFKPELVIVSAGFDSRKNDLLGCFRVTDKGFVRLTRLVMDIAGQYAGGKLISVLEGGYNLRGNASAASHHVQTLLEYTGNA